MDLWTKLSQTDKPIVLYGMGNGADLVCEHLESLGIQPSGVFASDDFVRRKTFRDMPIYTYSELKKIYPEMLILVCFGTGRREVIENIERIATEQELYCPDAPVYGNDFFDFSYLKEHEDELTAVYNLLEDDVSKKTFEGIVRFKLAGKYEYLKSIECHDSPMAPLLLNHREIYMDLGAFTGDTAVEFLNIAENYRKMYLIEPDERSFKKLSTNLDHLENTVLLNVGIGDAPCQKTFAMRGGRNSSLNSNGKTISIESVDSILQGSEVTVIKMDVEGAEHDAIVGATQTILNHKPKIMAAGYHRSEDLFRIPLLIHNIRQDYKIKIRHYPHNLAWDTYFYFI